jgi:hypothetical protein
VQEANGLSRALPRWNAPRRRPDAIPMFRIPVRPLDDDRSGRILFLSLDQVAYFFHGSAAAQGLIHGDWSPPPNLAPNRIYIRTKAGIYQAVHRSLADLGREFGGPLFSIHQSLLINLNAVHDAYLRPVKPQVGMRVNAGIEYLTVARRRVAPLKRRLL